MESIPRLCPVGKGGLKIVLRAMFKIDDSNGFLFVVSNSLFKRTMSFLINHAPQSPTATDEKEAHASDNEEDLSIVLIDDEA